MASNTDLQHLEELIDHAHDKQDKQDSNAQPKPTRAIPTTSATLSSYNQNLPQSISSSYKSQLTGWSERDSPQKDGSGTVFENIAGRSFENRSASLEARREGAGGNVTPPEADATGMQSEKSPLRFTKVPVAATTPGGTVSGITSALGRASLDEKSIPLGSQSPKRKAVPPRSPARPASGAQKPPLPGKIDLPNAAVNEQGGKQQSGAQKPPKQGKPQQGKPQQGKPQGKPQQQQNQAQKSEKGGKQNAKAQKAAASAPSQPRSGSDRFNMFSHLPQISGKAGKKSLFPKGIHPAVVTLGLMYREGTICGSTARCYGMLKCFQQVIKDFVTPPKQDVGKGLITHINAQVQYIIESRPIAVSMGNAIRYLKNEIARLCMDPSGVREEEVRKSLLQSISNYLKDKIEYAGEGIAAAVAEKIKDGDIILTHARSHVVELGLKYAYDDDKKNIHVIIVESRPKCEGKHLLRSLVHYGIKCTYVWPNSLSYVMKDVSKVLIGAHALMTNGCVVSRMGTANVCNVAKTFHVPVLVCCETIKFSDRVQLDSITANEIGDPCELIPAYLEDRVDDRATEAKESAKSAVSLFQHIQDNRMLGSATASSGGAVSGVENLHILNLMYDLTPLEFVDMVVTEVGILPPTSVPVVIREFSSDRGVKTVKQ